MNLKEKTIAHYKEMIEWASTQCLNREPNIDHMFKEIYQNWDSDYCPYCIEFNSSCIKCPLRDIDNKPKNCCKGLYKKMLKSKTWKGWIKRAKKVLEYINKNGE